MIPLPTPQQWQEFILISKVIGGIVVIVGALYGAGKFLYSMIDNARNINKNVNLLLINHFPHLQTAIDEGKQQITELAGDVKNLDTKMEGMSCRLEDTKKGVHTLGESFLRHLEATSSHAHYERTQILEAVEDITPANVVVNVAAPTEENQREV
jgi:hypothetical protein